MQDDGAPDRDRQEDRRRPRLKRRDILALVVAAYRASFPYFLLIVIVLFVVVWLLTEVAFRP